MIHSQKSGFVLGTLKKYVSASTSGAGTFVRAPRSPMTSLHNFIGEITLDPVVNLLAALEAAAIDLLVFLFKSRVVFMTHVPEAHIVLLTVELGTRVRILLREARDSVNVGLDMLPCN